MSKERELLAMALIALEDAHLHIDKFQDEDARLSVIEQIKELLAQPEPDNTRYLLDQVSRLTAENAILKEKWSSPKREPLSDETINDMYKTIKMAMATHPDSYWVGIRDAEKAHGIGVNNE